jgi:predicted phosphodiesterase
VRIFALSDVHVDYPANRAWLEALPGADHAGDALLLAGDVSDNLSRLRATLALLRSRFAAVFFVPGNHDLWVRRRECDDSMAKFRLVLELCEEMGVHTSPARLGPAGARGVWVVPLFSWYVEPGEGDGSLFVPKEGEDASLEMWADRYFARWPGSGPAVGVADAFLRMNEAHVRRSYDAPVISFSHFVPRAELMARTAEERAAGARALPDRNPRFNFSRVAGCAGLDAQVRELRAAVHVYGHQHRNRERRIDGVLYVSHCLGYPSERESGHVGDVGNGPKLIWPRPGPEAG